MAAVCTHPSLHPFHHGQNTRRRKSSFSTARNQLEHFICHGVNYSSPPPSHFFHNQSLTDYTPLQQNPTFNSFSSTGFQITYRNPAGLSELMRTAIVKEREGKERKNKKPRKAKKIDYSQIFGIDINTLCNEGRVSEAMEILTVMDVHGVRPDFDTYNTLLQSCIRINALEEGRNIHHHMMKSGFESGKFIGNQLLNLYAKSGRVDDAWLVFDEMPHRDSVTWTSMIAAYAQNGRGEEAFRLYGEMLEDGKRVNMYTFGTVLSGLAGMQRLEEGRIVHGQMLKSGFGTDVYVRTALVDLYFKCGKSDDAWQVFEGMPEKNVVSWNAMIAGYSQNRMSDEARKVFDRMPERDGASWSAMVGGYVQNGQGDEAISLFSEMLLEGIKPGSRVFASVVRACASLAAFERGKNIHTSVIKLGLNSDVFVGSALVDMYAKCGVVQDAWTVFQKMPRRNVITWNAMIAGYAQNGFGKKALDLFEQMLQMGVKPDNVTFVCVLYACSHLGLVDEGRTYFESMSKDHNVLPNHEHFVCMVDLFGRAGLLGEAEEFINRMPTSPTALVWLTLLGACRTHGNAEIGERAFHNVFELDPHEASAYVLLSNIYAVEGRWGDVAKLRKLMKDMGVKKDTGRSWIEIKNKVHSFVASDRSHPLTEEIYAKLEILSNQIRRAGYVPNTNYVLQDLKQHEKEYMLRHHSEKLAVAFGLISTPAGSSVRVVKNLRMCGDCHSALKYISKLAGREITVRDVTRFHHFKDGLCSCKDFW